MSRIAPNIANQLAESKAPLHSQGGQPRSPLLLHWFADENNWEQLGQNKIHLAPPEVQAQLLYALPLNSNEVKLSTFEEVLGNAHSRLYRTAQRLQAKLPQNDLETQQRIEAALAEADYPHPWGDPPHAAGNPGLKYTRVAKDSEVLAQLGVSFEKSFKTAWKDPRGLIWAGDILRDDQGKKRVLSWEEAKNACFNLNPTQDKREKVKASYESIESNQELIGLRKTYFKERNEETKDLLIKKYTELKQNQVPGCFPPTFEDALLYGRDQGYLEQNSKFVPRFLKGVHKQWFWSGSGFPIGASFAFSFNGSYGNVGDVIRDAALSVRCVYPVPSAW